MLGKVAEGITNPRTVKSYLHGSYLRKAINIDRQWYQLRYSHLGESVLAEDWDTLLILDGARADIFREIAPFPRDQIDTRYSVGSYSGSFLRRTFGDGTYHGTVYVTANPHVHELPADCFHAVRNLLVDEWEEAIGTVPPDAVMNAAIKARKQYPHKRLIVHFMQPHYPFLGPSGREIAADIGKSPGCGVAHPWNAHMWDNRYTHDELETAYRENFEVVFPIVSDLLGVLEEKVAITSDHGNLLGEWGYPLPTRIYGHPDNFPHPKLLKVPWYVEKGNRLNIFSDPPENSEIPNEDTIENRLDALGYY